MNVFSPAKINIGLQIGHRRSQDGYHHINSIFVPISFGDDLEITPCSQDCLSSENKLSDQFGRQDFDKITKKSNLSLNLLWRALEKTRPFRNTGLAVHIIKRVPLGSGLGGASSNAGTVLKYISQNCLQKHPAYGPELISKLALELGADVPFFLHAQAMLVAGIGDLLKPLHLGSGVGLLGLRGISLSTARAYAMLKRPLQAKPFSKGLYGLDDGILKKALECSDWRAIHVLRNDFEGPVFSIHGELKEVKTEFLQEGSDYALMSGSGSSVYALLRTESERDVLRKKMQAKFPSCSFVPFYF